jgi:ribosomal protein L37AE/L43A
LTNAWLVMAVGDDRQHGANDGYHDVPAESYSWDTTVPNHASLAPGDPIVLWDKRTLLGASVIERIDRGNATKPVYRCSICGGSNIKPRKTQTPPWRCFKCKQNFDQPAVQLITVGTYVARHDAGWVDLQGVLTGEQLRALCVHPRSQLSLRPLRWAAFRTAVGRAGDAVPLTHVDARADVAGGHAAVTVRVRHGQATFRQRLLAECGAVCALSGPAPAAALDAAHLYSYAAVGRHHHHGGLLLRKDVHRLFDLGQLAVSPATLTVDVAADLRAFPAYADLHGTPMHVDPSGGQREWLRRHWHQHR